MGYYLTTSATLKHGKSRSVCYVLKGLKHRIICKSDMSEIIAVETSNSMVVGCYRPLKLIEGETVESSNKDFFKTLSNITESTSKPIYIGGDFNVNLRQNKKSKEGTLLQEFQDEFGLTQLVNKNTWVRTITTKNGCTVRRSLLDHIYTSDPDVRVVVEDRWTSDHSLIVLELKEKSKVIRCKTFKRCWKKFSEASIQYAVSTSIDELEIEQMNNSDDLNLYLMNSIYNAFDELCPMRAIRTAQPSDLATDVIERIKKKRKRKMALYNKTKEESLLDTIRTLDKKLKRKFNDVRRNLIRQKMQAGNKKSFWDTVRALQGNKAKEKNIIIKHEGNMISEPQKVSSVFADFFDNKVKKLSNHTNAYQWVRQESDGINICEKDAPDAVCVYGSQPDPT